MNVSNDYTLLTPLEEIDKGLQDSKSSTEPVVALQSITWPRVSIITPSLNQVQFIEETICSVLEQNYPDLEYIIIDGGSKDGTVDIIRNYEQRLSYWISEGDNGQTDAIQKGVRASTGEILAWQNSDDTYQPGAIINAVHFLMAHPETDVVYSDCNLIDEHSRVIGRISTKDYLLEECLFRHIIPNQTAFIRRKAWETVGGVDPDLHFVIEEDLWLKLGLVAKLDRLSGVWGNHRKYIGTKTVSQSSKFYAEHLSVLNSFFLKSLLPPRITELRDQVYANAHFLGALRLNMDQEGEKVGIALEKAIALQPSLVGECAYETIQRVIGWSWTPDVADPVRFVSRFFARLPASAAPLRQYRGSAIAEVAIGHFFKNYREGNYRIARHYLVEAIRNDPHWLQNRGVWSSGLKSFFRG